MSTDIRTVCNQLGELISGGFDRCLNEIEDLRNQISEQKETNHRVASTLRKLADDLEGSIL